MGFVLLALRAVVVTSFRFDQAYTEHNLNQNQTATDLPGFFNYTLSPRKKKKNWRISLSTPYFSTVASNVDLYNDVIPIVFSVAESALIPSRIEPFGLVAVEFGRKCALGLGVRVDGLGQMPGWWSNSSVNNNP